MSGIRIDVEVNDSQLTRSTSNFYSYSQALQQADTANNKTAASTKKMRSELKQVKDQVAKSAAEIGKLSAVAEKVAKSTAAFAAIKAPFTTIIQDADKMKGHIQAANVALTELHAKAATQMKRRGEMSSLVGVKADLLLVDELNAGLEKQARLKAEIMKVSGKGDTVGALQNIEMSKAYTLELEKQLASEKNLAAIRRANESGKQAERIRTTKGITEAKKEELLIEKGLASAYDARSKLLVVMTKEQRAYAAAAMAGVAAAQKWANITPSKDLPTKATSAFNVPYKTSISRNIKADAEKAKRAIASLEARLKKLGTTKVPKGALSGLQSEIAYLNSTLAD